MNRTVRKRKRLTLLCAAAGVLWLLATSGPGHATTTATPWQPDPNSATPYGNVVFYDSNGNEVTGGSNLDHLFDYAAATTAKDAGATRATLYFAAPNHALPTSSWAFSQQSASNAFPNPTAPYPLTGSGGASPTGFQNPLDTLATTDANLNAAIGGFTLDATTGYANVIQVRLKDSGAGGAGSGSHYWNTDIAYNNTASPIVVDGANVPPNSWVQLFPLVTSTTTTLSSPQSGTTQMSGSNVQLNASITPSTASGSVVFYDGMTALGHSPVTSGASTFTDSRPPTTGNHSYTASFLPGPTPGDETGAGTTSATILGGSSSSPVSVTIGSAGPASTTTTTSLSGGGKSGTSITVPSGTAVTDHASLSGTNAASATGTVTYTVYSDTGCTTVASAGTAETITTPGTLPSSTPVTLNTGTYYWQASYSGDSTNAASKSTCGTNGEVETVTAPSPASTTTTTSLSGGGQSGTSITVPSGTAVTDHASLSGTNAASATGTVTYTVYSDTTCTTVASAGTAKSIVTAGSLPASDPVTLNPGTYYWQASYSGDSTNAASKSTCGTNGEVETVNAGTTGAAATTTTTSLSGGGKSGTSITVPSGTAVTDQATLTGTNAATATGSVTYTVYSDTSCTTKVYSDAEPITTAGHMAASDPVTLNPGTYYWQASYSGDSTNAASKSTCGTNGEVETVTPSKHHHHHHHGNASRHDHDRRTHHTDDWKSG